MKKNESNRSRIQEMIAKTAAGAFRMPEDDEPIEIAPPLPSVSEGEESTSAPKIEEAEEKHIEETQVAVAEPETPHPSGRSRGRRSAPKSQIASIEEYAELYFANQKSSSHSPLSDISPVRFHLLLHSQISQALSTIASSLGHISQTQYINNILREHLREHSALLNAELEKQNPPTIDF